MMRIFVILVGMHCLMLMIQKLCLKIVKLGLYTMSKEVEQLKKKFKKLEDIVDELRLCVKYLELDLEATKREMKGE